MMLYSYNCLECGEFEAFSTLANRHEDKPCPYCGEFGIFVQSPVRFTLEGITGHFPTAYDRFTQVHEKEAKREPTVDYSNL